MVTPQLPRACLVQLDLLARQNVRVAGGPSPSPSPLLEAAREGRTLFLELLQNSWAFCCLPQAH